MVYDRGASLTAGSFKVARKGIQLLFESFEDKRSTSIVGLLCIAYFFISYLPSTQGLMAKVLPPWPINIFAVIAFATLLAQGIVWKLFRHFEPKLYKNPVAMTLFICEYGLILFTVTAFSWPVYIIYAAAGHPSPVMGP
jgi:hypothetical protein